MKSMLYVEKGGERYFWEDRQKHDGIEYELSVPEGNCHVESKLTQSIKLHLHSVFVFVILQACLHAYLQHGQG